MKISVCTIARGRAAHLRNFIMGLAQQSVLPDELVIAHMQEAPYEALPQCPFPIHQAPVAGERLPLAAARNIAAGRASGEMLIFLDVDCIALPELVAAYIDAFDAARCLMGETRYLAQASEPSSMAFQDLWRASAQHPARRFGQSLGPGIRRIPQIREFWSLSFALAAQTFWRMGGFDERFEGYGAEDTDFAMSLAAHDVELWWTPRARAVHQWHAVQKPPLDHFEDILRNAALFRKKHGVWCMDYWLDQFEENGFIRRKGDVIDILRAPSSDERQSALCGGAVRFS